ncbi:MAG: SIS domain-containing protein [bacterium]|nr:SIS domain-containing protein [Candidatus Sumerlaeota bacterium]
MSEYRELAATITAEVHAVLDKVDSVEVDRLVDELSGARRVFIFAVGRVMLALECLGKRLGHLQIDCQIVGAVTEKPIGPEDLLLIASGSGESKLPAEITRIAKAKSARIGLITAADDSTIKRLSDFSLRMPCSTKTDPSCGIRSIQSMSTLFDQCLHLLGDVIAIKLQERRGLSNEELWKYHANLE